MSTDVMDLPLRRRFFAEEIEAVAKLQSPALVGALAAVPREQFLHPGPWAVLADVDFMGPARTRETPDADPARVYHNIAVAIDPARQLFNGQPGTLAVWIDALALNRGDRVLHVGSGPGYYSAVMAECVGAGGRVVAFEVDETLAAEAKRNLAAYACVDARMGDASVVGGPFDAILVNAGVTHPLDAWLEALADGGRMVLPLTATMPGTLRGPQGDPERSRGAMGSTISKGVVVLIARQAADFAARVLTVVAIYSAVGLRDEAMNAKVGKALMSGPMKWAGVTRLRRDAHEETPDCWLHGKGFCLRM